MKTLLTITAALAVAVPASAQFSVYAPNPADAVTEGSSSTGYPWDRDSATTASNDIRVQYIYDASNFSGLVGPVLLTGVNFRANATTSSWTGGSYGNVEVIVGEAGIDYTALASGNTFASSFLGGVKPSAAYTGPVAVIPGTGNGTGTPAPTYVFVSFASPVLYDPTSGNDLVLEIAHDGTWVETGGAASGGAFASDAASTNARRMYNLTDWTAVTSTGVSNTGIVAEFTYNPPSGIFASFSSSHTESGPGEVITLTNTSYTSDPSGFAAIDWDFDGDGFVDATGPQVTTAYGTCGPNNVTLTVTDVANGSDAVTDVATTVAAPVAGFSTTPLSSGIPLILQFNDTSTNGPTAWDWDLDGDGVFGDSTVQNPQWVYVTENIFNVTLRATNACGTASASFLVDTRQGICTQFGGIAGWTGGSAFYYDVDILDPAGLTIKSMDIQIQNTGVVGTLHVWVKNGTHVGSETDRTLWTKISEGPYVGMGTPNATPVDLIDFSLAPGTYGFALVYDHASGERFNYTTSGPTNVSNSQIALSNGAMHAPAFGSTTTFQPRNWNGCVFYESGMGAGRTLLAGAGCANSSGATAELVLSTGAPKLNSTTVFELSNAPANQAISAAFFSFQNLGGLDLGLIGMPGCALYPNAVNPLPMPTGAQGEASFSLPLNTTNPALAGTTFYVQAFTADPGFNGLGATVSNAVEAVIGS